MRGGDRLCHLRDRKFFPPIMGKGGRPLIEEGALSFLREEERGPSAIPRPWGGEGEEKELCW